MINIKSNEKKKYETIVKDIENCIKTEKTWINENISKETLFLWINLKTKMFL